MKKNLKQVLKILPSYVSSILGEEKQKQSKLEKHNKKEIKKEQTKFIY